tara:strand:- start:138 stop:407 length:270 start_codon:yes stop_codon:yes gene_type:complete
MLLMVNWELYPERKIDAFAAFSQMTAEDGAADVGPDITVIGRWHELASGTGVAIIESDSAKAVFHGCTTGQKLFHRLLHRCSMTKLHAL